MNYNFNTLYCKDCLPAMKQMADKTFDLAIVDPPYGIANVSTEPWGQTIKNPRSKPSGKMRGGKNKICSLTLHSQAIEAWDIIPDKEYFDELFRVSKNQIIWGGNYFDLPPTRGIIAWDKLQPWDNFSAFELAWTSFDVPASIFKWRATNIVKLSERIHPTQKPVELYRWLLAKHAATGDKILDTHTGSGASIIACIEHGYEWMGFEIDPEFCAKAQKRIDKVLAQGRMDL